MDEKKQAATSIVIDPNSVADLTQPLILEEHGEPLAVVLSYEAYQRLSHNEHFISSREARRLANRAVFGDLVGCPLSVDELVWVPSPKPHWRVPYRHFDQTLLIIVEVDASTGQTNLTAEARARLMAEMRTRSATDAAA